MIKSGGYEALGFVCVSLNIVSPKSLCHQHSIGVQLSSFDHIKLKIKTVVNAILCMWCRILATTQRRYDRITSD